MAIVANAELTVICSNVGGELQSIRDNATQIEYLWQGDRRYWGRRALNLFPFVGRMYQQSYLFHGKKYPMQLHGFLPNAPMKEELLTPEQCRFTLCDNEQTLDCYPFQFSFQITYRLKKRTLKIEFMAENRSSQTMYCAMGGHPGFSLPLENGLRFEDYSVCFPSNCQPNLVEFSPSVLCTGVRTPYPLQNGRLPLRHELFTQDAIVFADAPRSVSLVSDKGCHGIQVDYPQMPYVGFWHKPHTQAPYICIEPWSALPGREGIVEDLETLADYTSIAPHERVSNQWSITVW